MQKGYFQDRSLRWLSACSLQRPCQEAGQKVQAWQQRRSWERLFPWLPCFHCSFFPWLSGNNGTEHTWRDRSYRRQRRNSSSLQQGRIRQGMHADPFPWWFSRFLKSRVAEKPLSRWSGTINSTWNNRRRQRPRRRLFCFWVRVQTNLSTSRRTCLPIPS